MALNKNKDETNYRTFINECYSGKPALLFSIKKEYLTKNNFNGLKIISSYCNQQLLEKVYKKYKLVFDPNITIAIKATMNYDNYNNFIFLLDKLNDSKNYFYDFLCKCVQSYNGYKIFKYLIENCNLSDNDIKELLLKNTETYESSFKIFEHLVTINMDIFNQVKYKIFTNVCFNDELYKAELINKLSSMEEYVNSNSQLFITTCDKNSYACARFLTEINKEVNYKITYVDENTIEYIVKEP